MSNELICCRKWDLKKKEKERKKGKRKERQPTLLFVSKVQSFRRKLIVWKTWIYHNELDGFTIGLKTFLVESVEILGNVILKLLCSKICQCFGGLCNSMSQPVFFKWVNERCYNRVWPKDPGKDQRSWSQGTQKEIDVWASGSTLPLTFEKWLLVSFWYRAKKKSQLSGKATKHWASFQVPIFVKMDTFHCCHQTNLSTDWL